MKLPGVQYRGVQGLARQDVNAPVRLAGAEAGAMDAWSQAMRPAVEGADEILTDIAKERSNKAMNIYHAEKLKWQSEQIAMDEDGTPAWESGGTRYNSADEAARAKAGEVIGNSVHGQELFAQAADRANVQYGASWQNKVQNWYKYDQMATANASIELATQQRDFDRVTDIVADNSKRGIFTRVQTEKLFAVNDANRTNSSYLTSIEMAAPGGYSQLRNNIKNEAKFTDAAREQMSTRLDNQIIKNNGEALRSGLSTIEDNLGLAAAVEAGDLIIHSQAKVTSEEFDGFDSETARQKNRNANRAIWAEWKSRLTKKTAESTRAEGLACSIKGTCPPTIGKTDDQQKADDVLGLRLGWSLDGKKDYNRNGVESGVILANDQRGLSLRQMMVTDYKSHGYVGKATRETLDAAFTSNDPVLLKSGIQLYNMLSKDSPGAVVAKQAKIVEEYSDIVQSFDEDTAATMIMKYKAMSPGEQTANRESFNDLKYDDSDFESVMKEKMPHIDGGWFWFDAKPSYKRTLQKQIETKAKQLMPVVGGNVDAAYTAAINSTMQTYNVDANIGTVVKNPIATSVFGGNVDGGKWATDEMKEGIAGHNEGAVPDTFNYFPLPTFDPLSNPKYIVSWVNEQGEYKSIGYDATFQDTERGKEYFNEQAELSEELERQRLFAVDKQVASSSDEAWKNADLDTRLSVTADDVGEIFGKLFGKMGTGVEVAKKLSDYMVSPRAATRDNK